MKMKAFQRQKSPLVRGQAIRAFFSDICPKLHRYYTVVMPAVILILCGSPMAFAAAAGGGDMWSMANDIIKDVYNKIAGISTVLAGLMSAVAVIGAKLSNNQHKTDQACDWLKKFGLPGRLLTELGPSSLISPPLFSGWANLDGTHGTTSG